MKYPVLDIGLRKFNQLLHLAVEQLNVKFNVAYIGSDSIDRLMIYGCRYSTENN